MNLLGDVRVPERPIPNPSKRKSQARRELEKWIDGELEFYVKDMINDQDYAKLRTNLIDIALAFGAAKRRKVHG